MAEYLQGAASKADGQRPRRSWLAPALAMSLTAHAGLAAMLWVEQPPQPKAGAVVGVEIVSAAGATSSSSTHSGASPARGELAKPATAPAPSTPPPPDAPRAAREAPHAALPPRDAPAVPAPEHAAAPPRDDTALRRPARAAREAAPSAASPSPAAPRRALAAPRVQAIALRRPARIPPPPANAPRLAAAAAARGTERAQARPQTASVPIVAADAAPGAGAENGTTPPRYGFGSAANPIPRYPRLARENGWEGVVMLTVQVGARGEALGVSIASSSGHGLLDAAAVDAVRRWHFEPARRAGMPVAGSATVPIRFRLEE